MEAGGGTVADVRPRRGGEHAGPKDRARAHRHRSREQPDLLLRRHRPQNSERDGAERLRHRCGDGGGVQLGTPLYTAPEQTRGDELADDPEVKRRRR